jgi:predicted nuclease of predicted toxin-antitoxin system
VKLLFDQNLSRKLVAQLSTVFPGSTHVVFENLDASDDQVIWEFAKNAGYIIVSRDSDFRQLSFLHGIRRKPSGFVSATLRQKPQRTY